MEGLNYFQHGGSSSAADPFNSTPFRLLLCIQFSLSFLGHFRSQASHSVPGMMGALILLSVAWFQKN